MFNAAVFTVPKFTYERKTYFLLQELLYFNIAKSLAYITIHVQELGTLRHTLIQIHAPSNM